MKDMVVGFILTETLRHAGVNENVGRRARAVSRDLRRHASSVRGL